MMAIKYDKLFCALLVLSYLCKHKVNKNDRNFTSYRVNYCYCYGIIVCEGAFEEERTLLITARA